MRHARLVNNLDEIYTPETEIKTTSTSEKDVNCKNKEEAIVQWKQRDREGCQPQKGKIKLETKVKNVVW